MKPCPFCGDTPGDDSYTLTDGGFKYGAISCGCGAVGPDVRTLYKQWPEWKDAAVAEWNERAIPADQILVPRRLLEAIEKTWRIPHPQGKPFNELGERAIEEGLRELRTLLHP